MTRDHDVKTETHSIFAKPAKACCNALSALILCCGVAVISATSYQNDASANMSGVEQSCFDDFHRYGGTEWRRAVRGQAADGPVDDIDLHKCKPFVSTDFMTWIGSDPSSGESVGSRPAAMDTIEKECQNLFRRQNHAIWRNDWGQFDFDVTRCDEYVSADGLTWIGLKVDDPGSTSAQKAEPGISTEGMSEVEIECSEAFHRNNGLWWLNNIVYGDNDSAFDPIPCLPFVSKDMKTWIESEPDSGESAGSEPVNFALKIVPNPPDGKVFLNGVYKGLGVVKLDLAQGTYLVEVTKDGFEPFEKDVELNQSITLEVAMNPVPAPTPEPQQEVTSNAEVVFWQTIKDSNDPAMFEEYLRQFPEGVGLFSRLAKLKLQGLKDKNIPKTASIPELDYGSYHALVIGNNKYRHLPDLKTAVADARRVSDILEELYGFEVSRLENANRKQILRLVSDLRKKISEKDNLLIYYAGHGHLDEGAGEGYWLPVDADPEDPSNWLMTDQIVSQIRAMSAKHVLIVSDSCFSGVLTRGIKIVEKTPSYLARMTNSKARLALTSGGLEPVADSGGSGHSVFAAKFISLLEANQSVLDGTQLFSELRPQVMLNSDQTPEYGRIRKAGDAGGDFLFVRQ